MIWQKWFINVNKETWKIKADCYKMEKIIKYDMHVQYHKSILFLIKKTFSSNIKQFSVFLYKAWATPCSLGSPLGLTLANAFLIFFQKNWLQNCSSDFRSHYNWWYVDNIFVLFTSPEHLEAFKIFWGQNANMSFTIKNEKQNRMSFPDLQIILKYLPLLSTLNLP